jgi:hypothetical protein
MVLHRDCSETRVISGGLYWFVVTNQSVLGGGFPDPHGKDIDFGTNF